MADPVTATDAPTVDGRWSWCRLLPVGPPCARLCGPCARTERAVHASGALGTAIARMRAGMPRCLHDLTPGVCGYCLGTWRSLPPLPEAGPGGALGLHSGLFRAARQPTDDDAGDGLSPVDLDLALDEEDDDA